jgi:HlyD family secretion protein
VRAKWVTATVGLAVVLAGVVSYWRSVGADSRPAVATATVTRGDVVASVDATGTLQAVTTVQVGTQVSGTIKALHADFNQPVRRGQVVAELEPSLFQTQVEQARASVVRLEAEARRAVVQSEDALQKLGRARDLAAKALIPASDLDTAETAARAAAAAVESAEAQIVQARAALNQSQVNLGHTVIRAPIDGVVISRNVDVGQTVAASMQAPTLFVIAQDLTAMQVNANVAESDIGRIRSGQPVSFRVDAYPGDVFSGVVSLVRLNPVVEQNVVSYVTTIDVANLDLRLKPGMTATVTIEVERAAGVLRVPNAALRVRPTAAILTAMGQRPDDAVAAPPADAAGPVQREGRGPAAASEVWVLRGQALVRVPVVPGTSDASHTAIVGGALEEGAVVAIGFPAEQTTTNRTTTRSPLLPAPKRPGASGTRTR